MYLHRFRHVLHYIPNAHNCLTLVFVSDWGILVTEVMNMQEPNQPDAAGSPQSLPPKTCSIERLITRDSDIDKVLQGEKTATRRNGRYADIGETMELRGHKFEVTNVYRQSLGELTDADAQSEGFADVAGYRDSILSIHPGMPWLPHMQVWVHEFRKAE